MDPPESRSCEFVGACVSLSLVINNLIIFRYYSLFGQFQLCNNNDEERTRNEKVNHVQGVHLFFSFVRVSVKVLVMVNRFH